MRTSNKDLDDCAKTISNLLERDFYVNLAYGRPRLQERLKSGGESDTSPRLPTGQLLDWMFAFIRGIVEGRLP